MHSNTDQPAASMDQVVMVGKIIIVALITGILVFGSVIVLKSQQPPAGARQLTPMTSIGLGLVAGVAVLQSIIPKAITSAQLAAIRRELANGLPVAEVQRRLASVFQVQLIAAAGVVEFGAMFNLIAYMQDRHLFSIVAVAICLLMLTLRIPTQGKVANWMRMVSESIE